MVVLGAVIIFGAVVLLLRRRSADGVPIAIVRAVRDASPPAQAQWIMAMVVEHDSLDDHRIRRRFGRGCLQAVVLYPTGEHPSLVGGVTGLLGAGAIGLAIYGLVSFPSLRTGWAWIVYFVAFIVTVVAYLFGARLIGRLAIPFSGPAAVLAAGLAALTAWWIAYANIVVATPVIVLLALPCVFVAGYVARRSGRSAIAAATMLAASVAVGLSTFVAYVSTTYITGRGPTTHSMMNQFATGGYHDSRSLAISDDLTAAVVLLIVVPLTAIALSVGVIRVALPHKHPGSAAA